MNPLCPIQCAYVRTRRRPSSSRRGVTLLELVAVMSIGSILFGIAVVTMVALHRADRTFHQSVNDRQALAEIGARLRGDLRAAERCAWDGDSHTLRLSLPEGETLLYQAQAERWERRRAAAGAEEKEAELTAANRLTRGTTIAVTPVASEAGQLVTVQFELPPSDRAAPRPRPIKLHVTATVGRDLRLLHERDAP